MAETVDVIINRGITWVGEEVLLETGEGDALDLTGWTAYAEARSRKNEVIDLEPDIVDAVGGRIRLSGTDEWTQTLPTGHFSWDLVIENPAGERLGPFAAGSLTVIDPATQKSTN